MIKIIKQHDTRDCGAACLAMIAAAFGSHPALSLCRTLTKTDRNGASLYGLADGAAKFGLRAEPLFGSPQELEESIRTGEIRFPFIAHIVTEDSLLHYVVVFSYRRGRFIIGDPAYGKAKYTSLKFFSLWDGYIVTFSAADDFQKIPASPSSLYRFFSLLNGQKALLCCILLLSLLISAIGISGSLIFQFLISDILQSNGSAANTLAGSAVPSILDEISSFLSVRIPKPSLFFSVILALYILQAAIQFARGGLMAVLSRKIDLELTHSYFNHLIDLPLSEINTHDTGEYLSRFSDASAIRTAVSGAVLALLLDSLMVAACGVILFLTSPLLFLISLGMVLLYALIVLFYHRPLERSNHSVMENNARVQSYLKESVDGIESVKAHRAEASIQNTFAQKLSRLLRSIFQNNLLSASQESLCGMVELTGTVLILWTGYGLVQNHILTLASLVTFYALLVYFTAPIKNLIELQPVLQTAFAAAERLSDILDTAAESDSVSEIPDSIWQTIDLSHIDFRYANHELTLRDVSLHLEKGQRVALIGESGSGKTTIAKLLLRFYQAESGTILIDGQPIQNIPLSRLRKEIAYVEQTPFFFSDTILNNLRLGAPTATEEEILRACQLAHADGFIEKLPMGYDTFLEENGHDLSGGQRQRLAIARALLRKPKLLILDEATSNLDTITEDALKETIFSLERSFTCLIIAHRLSTIESCDRIFVMENGMIAESGTHTELLAAKGRYADYALKQHLPPS